MNVISPDRTWKELEKMNRNSVRDVVFRLLIFLGLFAVGLAFGCASSVAEQPVAASRTSLTAAGLRDGLIYSGGVVGDSTSVGHLVLEKNFRETKLLRWQSEDAQLGKVDTDFFQPRLWGIYDGPIQELSFQDRSPDPAMRGRVLLGGVGAALAEIVVGEKTSRYQMTRADIGLRFSDESPEGVDGGQLARNLDGITSSNFQTQKCHMRSLRVAGPQRAVLDDTSDGVVEVFDLDGQRLKLPAELKDLPVNLLVSGKHSGTTGLRVDYTLPDQTTLEQEIAVHVSGEIAKGQGCPESVARSTSSR
jgi:hypothetical protein